MVWECVFQVGPTVPTAILTTFKLQHLGALLPSQLLNWLLEMCCCARMDLWRSSGPTPGASVLWGVSSSYHLSAFPSQQHAKEDVCWHMERMNHENRMDKSWNCFRIESPVFRGSRGGEGRTWKMCIHTAGRNPSATSNLHLVLKIIFLQDRSALPCPTPTARSQKPCCHQPHYFNSNVLITGLHILIF